MPDIKDSISLLPFVGPARSRALTNLKIETVEDLLKITPKKIIDLTKPDKIADLSNNNKDNIVLSAKIKNIKLFRTPRKKMWLTQAVIEDDTGELKVVWFNQPYLNKVLKKGEEYIFKGIYNREEETLNSPEIFPEKGLYLRYPFSSTISTKQLSQIIHSALSEGYSLPEIFPQSIVESHNLIKMSDVSINIHKPKKINIFFKCKQRLILNELTIFILKNLYAQKKLSSAHTHKITQADIKPILDKCGFSLTADQVESFNEIVDDLESGNPMNRLLQGDVGSGKTIVGLLSAYSVIKSGYKVIWFAPTLILAQQHYETAKKFFEDLGIDVGLMTSYSKDENYQNKNLLIGTHALLYKEMDIGNVGLIVVDEQQRFGVNQRIKYLKEQNKPHYLSLSATPIPRSLAQVIYGNMQVSTIKTKPINRKKIKTFLIPEVKRSDAFKFIGERIEVGEQAFIVCPIIEGDESSQEQTKKSVVREYEKIKKSDLGKYPISLLHGQLPDSEKNEIMQSFARGKSKILVTTTVVEVGIDIPNATVLVIEDSENFGLSQLHQLRGRVGRSGKQSYCFCFSNNLKNPKTVERLKAFVQSDDGFQLSELDLKLRGPGAIFGTSQAGFIGLNPQWFEDKEVMYLAKKIAQEAIDHLDEKNYLNLKNEITNDSITEHLE